MMRQLAEAQGCRVAPLLTYFGEQLAGGCGHCDNCSAPSVPSPSVPSPSIVVAGPYPLHSTVRHREWGLGRVLGYDQDRMTVLFDDVGYKTLSVAVVRKSKLLVAADAG
jgi:ATP-dependent DNA helicase RecQ